MCRSGGGGAVKKFVNKKIGLRTKPVLDARNKIIQKNRAKIHDARDKLGQIAKRSGDARLKLLEKNIRFLKKFGELDTAVSALKRTGPNTGGGGGGAAASAKVQKRVAMPIKRGPTRGLGNEMDIEMEYYPTASSTNLRRTVKNDIAYVPTAVSSMPPLPTFDKYNDRRMATVKRAMDYEYEDPFDCYEVPVARPYDVSEPRNLNRSVLGAHMDTYNPHKSSLRSSSSSANNGMGVLEYERSMPLTSSQYKGGAGISTSDLMSSKRYIADENSHLSHEMRVRLQRPPDANQSAGIFTNPYAPNSRERIITNAGYRIVVSNLHSSVSQSDIKVM